MDLKHSIILFLLLLLASCSKSDTPDNISRYGVKLGEDGEYYMDSSRGVPEETFRSDIVGYAWVCKESHLILEDGGIEDKDYYAEVDGGSPRHFFIDIDNIEIICFSDAKPGWVSESYPYSYIPSTGKVKIDPYYTMTLVSYDKSQEELTMVFRLYGRRNLLTRYRRITADGWKEYQALVNN